MNSGDGYGMAALVLMFLYVIIGALPWVATKAREVLEIGHSLDVRVRRNK